MNFSNLLNKYFNTRNPQINKHENKKPVAINDNNSVDEKICKIRFEIIIIVMNIIIFLVNQGGNVKCQ